MPSVLTIDDYQATRDTNSTILRLAGFKTASAATGQAGIALALQEPFDVLLVDLQLPDTSGIDVVRELKRRHVAARMVIVTALTQQDFTVVESNEVRPGVVDMRNTAMPFRRNSLTPPLRETLVYRRHQV